MTPEDLAQMARHLEQEALLYRYGFEPVLPDGRELWTRNYELFVRGRALVVTLEELAAGDRDNRSYAVRLTRCNDVSSNGERGES